MNENNNLSGDVDRTDGSFKEFLAAALVGKDAGALLRGHSIEDVLLAHLQVGHPVLCVEAVLSVTGHMDLTIHSETVEGASLYFEVRGSSVEPMDKDLVSGYARSSYRAVELDGDVFEGFVRRLLLIQDSGFTMIVGADPVNGADAILSRRVQDGDGYPFCTLNVLGNSVRIS